MIAFTTFNLRAGGLVLVNAHRIVAVLPEDNGSRVLMTDETELRIAESHTEVVQTLQDMVDGK